MTEVFDIYNYLWYFVIYAFLGWCVEVAYAALKTGRVVNRGFLCGPFCPIYGFGMVAILSFFDQLLKGYAGEGHNGLLLFFGGMLITSSIELFGGWALRKLFNIRWWDYTGRPFNFHGYICAQFSVIWGLGTVFIYKIVHPTVSALTVGLLPRRVGSAVLALAYITIAADMAVTVAILIGLDRELSELSELRNTMRAFSDNLSDRIGESTIRNQNAVAGMQVQAALAGMEARDELEERRSEAQARYAEARERYEAAREEADFRREAARAEAGQRLENARMEIGRRLDAAREEAGQRQLAAREEAGRRITAAREEAISSYLERRAEAEQRYEERRRRLMRNHVFGLHRLIRSYPGSHHDRYDEVFEELKKDDE